MSKTYLFKDIVIGEEWLLKWPFGSDLKRSLYVPKWEDTYKVYLQENILSKTNSAGTHYISKEYYEKAMKRYSVKEWDFIVTCDWTLWEIFQLKGLTEKWIISSSLLRITLNKDIVDENYFYYLFKAKIKRQLIVQWNNSVLKHLPGVNIIRNHEIELPGLEQQRKIWSILKLFDDKIELNNKINSELEAMAKELYEYRFVQFDFPDENGKPYKSSGWKMVWNDELKREIPERWEVKTLGDIIVENKKSTLKVSDVSGSWEYPFFTSWEEILLHGEALVDWLNCYMNTGGNWDVKVYNWKAAFSTDTWCIRWKDNSTAYLSQILLSFRPRLDIKFFAWTGLQHLQKDLLKMENIVMPHKNILDKFNEDIETITLKISNNKKQNKDLTELRDFLLPMLMNGQVTVK